MATRTPTSITKKSSVGLAFVFFVTLFLVITPWGNRIALSLTQQFVPDLKVELTAGSLLFSPRIRQLSYENTQFSVRANQISIDWQWRCFWRSELCIKNASVEALAITIKQPDANGEIEANTIISKNSTAATIDTHIPWPIDIEALSVKALTVASQQTSIGLEKIEFNGNFPVFQ